MTPHPPTRFERVLLARRYAANAALVAAILAALALGFSGFGVHELMFDLDYAVTVLATGWAPALAIVGGGLGLITLIAGLVLSPRHDRVVSLVAIAIAAVVYALATEVRAREFANPPIHDVATDWSDPLLFGPTLTAARGPDADPVDPNPVVQAQPQDPNLTGTPLGQVNARTCPGAAPVVMLGGLQAAYDKAHAAVVKDGLTLVTENPADGRIEATATTHWLHLKGDVVVRVKPDGSGARVDIRSVSRTGIRDLGENCRRVTRLRTMIAK